MSCLTFFPACCIAANKPQLTVEHARKLINTHQFNNEPFRVLLASLGSGLNSTDAFLASTLSKHLLRELKFFDAAHKNPDALKWNGTNKRYGFPTGTSKEEEFDDDGPAVGAEGPAGSEGHHNPALPIIQPRLPTKANPIGVTLYGQICLSARSYQSALCKFPIRPSPKLC